jgi:hypothetical protein
MSVAASQGQIEAEESASKATLRRFAKPKPYERWAELAAFAIGLSFLWPFLLIWTLFAFRPDLNENPAVLVVLILMLIGVVFSARSFNRFASWCKRAIIRSGVARSFQRSGKSLSGDFVGVSYSERILNLNRGVDWDFGFLELQPQGLRFQGDRSSFLLSHDRVEATELRQYRLTREGWFVRLFVRWIGENGTPECLSLCFQDGGMPRPARHELTETWKRRIEDWRWNHMGMPVSHQPELPVDSSPVDNTISRRVPIPRKIGRIAWLFAVLCTIPIVAVMVLAMFLFSWDWCAGLLAVTIIYCPVVLRAVFVKLLTRLRA